MMLAYCGGSLRRRLACTAVTLVALLSIIALRRAFDAADSPDEAPGPPKGLISCTADAETCGSACDHIFQDTKSRPDEATDDNCVAMRLGTDTSYNLCLHPPGDLISDTVRREGAWEILPLSRFEHDVKMLGPNGLVIDIGANLGEYGLLGAALGRHVWMVDPMSVNTNRILSSIKANGWDAGKISVIRAAMSCKKGELVKMEVNKENMGGSMARVGSSVNTGNDNVAVGDGAVAHAISLSMLSDRVPKTALHDGIAIKVDVEGLECEVITGAGSFLRRFKGAIRTIYMEWGTLGRGKLPDRCDARHMVEMLYDAGFRAWYDVEWRDRSWFLVPLPRRYWRSWPWDVKWYPR